MAYQELAKQGRHGGVCLPRRPPTPRKTERCCKVDPARRTVIGAHALVRHVFCPLSAYIYQKLPMLVLILGIILLIGGFVISPHSLTAGRLRLPLRYAGLAFILIGLFTASLVEIGAGEVGVKLLFGNVQ